MFRDPVAYDNYMGRYSVMLAPRLADLAGVSEGQRVLDVGAGTGAFTRELVSRVGAANVAAAEPSEQFVGTLRSRFPDVEVVQARAEALPFPAGNFDAAVAQLVVHFMSDPLGGIGEMRRVTRPGGVIAACSWDEPTSEASPLSKFWAAVRQVDPSAGSADARPGTHEGEMVEFFEAAGLENVEPAELWIHVRHETFEEWWGPYETGQGPVGRYVESLTGTQRAKLRESARDLVGDSAVVISARAWAAKGVVPA